MQAFRHVHIRENMSKFLHYCSTKTSLLKGLWAYMFYSNISNYQLKETKKNNMSQKLNWTICTHLSYFITHFKLYYWLKKYQNKAIRVLKTNERESKKSTSSPTFIYLKGHNPPYHTRPCLSYIKGKILSIYIWKSHKMILWLYHLSTALRLSASGLQTN